MWSEEDIELAVGVSEAVLSGVLLIGYIYMYENQYYISLYQLALKIYANEQSSCRENKAMDTNVVGARGLYTLHRLESER